MEAWVEIKDLLGNVIKIPKGAYLNTYKDDNRYELVNVKETKIKEDKSVEKTKEIKNIEESTITTTSEIKEDEEKVVDKEEKQQFKFKK